MGVNRRGKFKATVHRGKKDLPQSAPRTQRIHGSNKTEYHSDAESSLCKLQCDGLETAVPLIEGETQRMAFSASSAISAVNDYNRRDLLTGFRKALPFRVL